MRSGNDKKVMHVLVLTLVLNVIVTIAKLFYGWITNSLSLEADGFHSLIDSSSNIIGITGIFLASKPPDEGHPYGHRKIEALTSLTISFLLFITCYEIASNVIDRLQNPIIPTVNVLSFVIMGFTMAVNIFVATYEKKQAQLLKSDILFADSIHTKSDIFVSLSVIASFVAVLLHVPVLDMVIAGIIVIYIITVAFRVLIGSIDILLDAQLLPPNKIQAVIEKIPGIIHCHKIRSRGTRSGIFVDLHIHVDPLLTTEASHALTHQAINAIEEQFPEVLDVLIHTEPAYLTNVEKHGKREEGEQ